MATVGVKGLSALFTALTMYQLQLDDSTAKMGLGSLYSSGRVNSQPMWSCCSISH